MDDDKYNETEALVVRIAIVLWIIVGIASFIFLTSS